MKFLLHTIFVVFSMVLFAQQTYVPDDNFEQALIDLGYDDVLDDYVLTSNIITVTELILSYKNISDMTGIEEFEALEHLESNGNHHNSLDISQNANLTYLDCSGSEVDELVLNNALITLHCSSNQLTNIDLSNCINLRLLRLDSNSLTELDVSNNNLLIELGIIGNLIENIDLNNNPFLETLSCSSNYLTEIDTSNNPLLINLYCGYNNVPIASIDVSNNPLLEILFVKDSGVKSLDLSNNTNLISLGCNINQLTELNLTNNPIYFIEAQNNQLEWIDIRNGYNDNMLNFDATNNPYLHCVFVDDTNFLNPNNWHVDDNNVFMESEAECDIGISESEISDMSLFPNPAKEVLYIQGETTPDFIFIYSPNGQLLKKLTMYTGEVYVGDLPSGLYIIRFFSKDSCSSIPFLKE